MAFDPLSSQGLFHALSTGKRGGEIIRDASRSDPAAPARIWNAEIARIGAAYLKQLAACYAEEQRWRRSKFWRRRHEGLLGLGRPRGKTNLS